MFKQAVSIIALKLVLCLIPILSLSACERKSEFESCIEQICISPTVLNSGKVITLKVPNWHPQKLAVKSPSGEWYYVNDTDFQFFDNFETATEFSFVVRDLKAIKYTDGKPIVEMFFSMKDSIYSTLLTILKLSQKTLVQLRLWLNTKRNSASIIHYAFSEKSEFVGRLFSSNKRRESTVR